MRPGTLKAPLFADVPLIGRVERGVIDVVVYAALLLFLTAALLSPVQDLQFFGQLSPWCRC